MSDETRFYNKNKLCCRNHIKTVIEACDKLTPNDDKILR